MNATHQISELLNPKLINYFQLFSSVMFIIDIVAEFIYCKLVFMCTSKEPKEMKTFRILTLFYIFCSMMIEILLFLWKPIALLPFKVIYPTGVLAPMSSTTSLCFLLLTALTMSLMLETLLLILFEKYFVILAVVHPECKSYRIPCYVIIYSIYVGLLALIFYLAFGVLPADSEAQALLKANFVDAATLLSSQPSLLMAPKWSPSFILTLIIFGGYAGTRFLAANYLIYANFKNIKSSQSFYSERTRKQMSLIFRSTIAQLAVNFVIGFFPCIFWFLATLLSLGNSYGVLIFLICFSTSLSYPLLDLIAIIVIIKPYRKVVLKIIDNLMKLYKIPFNNASVTNMS